MQFRTIEKKVVANAFRYGREFKVKIDEDFALLKLVEEVGELAQAILIHRKKSRPEKHLPAAASKQEVAKELADVIGMAMVTAKLLNINLEEAIDKKWISRVWLKAKKIPNPQRV